MRIRPIVFAIGGISLVPLAASAGFIRMNMEPAFDLTNTPPLLAVTVSNEGDEPARAVELEASVAGWHSQTTNQVPSLRPGEDFRYVLPLTRVPVVPGVYPAVIKVRYGDRNGHRFSAITFIDLAVGDSKQEVWVVPTLDSATVADTVTLTLRLASMEDDALESRLRLVLPDELSCRNAERVVKLEPGTESAEVFEIRNESGLPGSTYAVAVVLETEAGGIHRGAVATGTVTVAALPERPLWKYGMWFGLSTGLVALLMVMQHQAHIWKFFSRA